MGNRGEDEDEPIRALFARLIADVRALVEAEVSLLRMDFYRRVARAKLAIALLVGAVLMGQATAVVLLMSLAFALSPYIGPFAGALVAALAGAVIAGLCARFGIRRLVSFMEDDGADKAGRMIEPLIERARARSRAARVEVFETVANAKARLQPQTLLSDLMDDALDHAQALAHRAVATVRKRPLRSGAIIFGILLLIVRPPLGRIGRAIVSRGDDETPKPVRGYRAKAAVTGPQSRAAKRSNPRRRPHEQDQG